jgi:hypothetical protein
VQTEQTSAARADVSARSEAPAEPEDWRVLAQTEDLGQFARAWTSLVARAADGVALVALLLGPADLGPFEIIARCPEDANSNAE